MNKLLLALLTAVSLITIASCNTDAQSEKVDYGPELEEKTIISSIVDMIRDTHPEKTKEGAFVHFETAQTVAGGAYESVTADTGHTVIRRTETDAAIVLDVVEIKYSYHQGTKPEKLSRQFQLNFEKATAASALTEASATTLLHSLQALRPNAVRTEADDGGESDAVRQTYHGLKFWENRAAPPDAIATQPGCLGISDCLITYRHVVFDVVIWDTPEGSRIHFEFVTSPDIPQTIGYNMSRIYPYIPGLMKSCITQMVGIGDGQSKTLLTECQNLVSFLYGG